MSASLAQIQYLARPGRGLSQKDAAIIGPELQRIAQDGGMTAARVVYEATPEASPLHPYFEWKDDKAAELYRHQQARQLIVSVVIKEESDAGRTLPAFVHVRLTDEQREEAGLAGDQSSYLPVAQVINESDRVQAKMEEAARQLRTWRASYEMWRSASGEFAERFQPIFEFVEGLEAAPDGGTDQCQEKRSHASRSA